MKLELIAFDLNGTLLDMSVLDPYFQQVFGTGTLARKAWFEQLQALWMKANATGEYQPFSALAQQALELLAADAGKPLLPEHAEQILGHLTKLPAFADARDGLAQLRRCGLPIAALTNGALDSAEEQLKFAGVRYLFDAVFSANEVQQYKPAPAPYLKMLHTLDVRPERALMVAAHDWDLAGARAVGLKTAFIERPGQPKPASVDHSVPDLAALASKLEQK